MNLLKKLSLFFAVVAFCISLSVISGYAQGRARWDGNNGRHKGWTQGQRNGWNRGRKNGWRNRDRSWQTSQYGRITPWEYRRLQRQRMRIYNTRNRYYRNDGYINRKERQELQNRRNRFRRNVYRDRRDW